MLRAVLRLLIPCLSLVVSLTALTHNAAACSGGPPPNQLVPTVLEAEFIVDGRVKWVDETGFNGIITVKRYLNGKGGPEEIIMSTMPASQVMYWQERSVSIPCGGGPRMQPMITGSRVIMFLQRSPDGTYYPTYQHIFSENRFAQFSESNSKTGVGYSLTDSWNDMQRYQLTRRQLIELIQSVPGMTTVKPTPSVTPVHAPLLVTTASGRHFRIPVDGAPAEEIVLDDVFRRNLSCWSDGCTAWSPEGVDKQMIGERTQVNGNVITTYPSINAAIAYSPLGDAYAAWEKTDEGVTLKIGTLPVVTAMSFHPDEPTSGPVSMRLGMNAPLSTPDALGAWSPDGRTLAFVDVNGLWFWDVFSPDAQPELSDYRDVTAVHGYSWTGRYLSVTDTNGKHYIDLVTGENFPDGAWGPDDRALLVYGSNSNIIYTVPHRELLPFLPKNVEVRYAEWTRRWAFVALVCDDEGICGVTAVGVQSSYYSYHTLPYIGYAFDYSADTQNLAVVKDGHTLTIRDAATQQHREIDLQGQLDDEIKSVEWLPSIFYDARYDGTAW